MGDTFIRVVFLPYLATKDRSDKMFSLFCVALVVLGACLCGVVVGLSMWVIPPLAAAVVLVIWFGHAEPPPLVVTCPVCAHREDVRSFDSVDADYVQLVQERFRDGPPKDYGTKVLHSGRILTCGVCDAELAPTILQHPYVRRITMDSVRVQALRAQAAAYNASLREQQKES